ncbi:hypothetical protein HDU82_007766 [Entophlyctis luteolus]|nr:hypothetical protein HDU82_007756 [Entophlyctis luteolus]KAJ3212688.1 hypothetical protein HDU82_007766 [Entophlyctis luteolus]
MSMALSAAQSWLDRAASAGMQLLNGTDPATLSQKHNLLLFAVCGVVGTVSVSVFASSTRARLVRATSPRQRLARGKKLKNSNSALDTQSVSSPEVVVVRARRKLDIQVDPTPPPPPPPQAAAPNASSVCVCGATGSLSCGACQAAEQQRRNSINGDVVSAIVDSLLELPVETPLSSAFDNVLADPRLTVWSSTTLPPFHAQIEHIIRDIVGAKMPNRPLLVEGPPGLGKGSALLKYAAEQGAQRPAVYFPLSRILRKKQGALSSTEVGDDEIGEEYLRNSINSAFPTDNPTASSGGYVSLSSTETETELEGDERMVMPIERDAWVNALKEALGYHTQQYDELLPELPDTNAGATTPMSSDPMTASFFGGIPLDDRENSALILQRQMEIIQPYNTPPDVDIRAFKHIEQAFRLIAKGSKSGPVLLILDDIQLLFSDRTPLTQKYDVLKLLKVRGYDWAVKLHAIESVDDETVIKYLLEEVNPCISEPSRRFTRETAALFVTTFDASLLEIDLRLSLGQASPQSSTPTSGAATPTIPQHVMSETLPGPTAPYFHGLQQQPQSPQHQRQQSPAAMRTAALDELRALFLEITMHGGILTGVARLDAHKRSLVECLVERNVLTWRGARKVRRRQSRAVADTVAAGLREAVRVRQRSMQAQSQRRQEHYQQQPWSLETHHEDAVEGQDWTRPPRLSNDGVGPWAAMTPVASARGTKKPLEAVAADPQTWFASPWADEDNANSDTAAAAAWIVSEESDSEDNDERLGSDEYSAAVDERADDSKRNSWLIGEGTSVVSLVSESTVPEADDVAASANEITAVAADITIDNHWEGATSMADADAEDRVKEMDASEQLALFAIEGAELVWSNGLVKSVCEGFVAGTSLNW